VGIGHKSDSILGGDYLTFGPALFQGPPTSLPFFREAATLPRLRDEPPNRPILAAIHRLLPRMPSSQEWLCHPTGLSSSV